MSLKWPECSYTGGIIQLLKPLKSPFGVFGLKGMLSLPEKAPYIADSKNKTRPHFYRADPMIPTSPVQESDIIGVVVDWFDSGHAAALATVVSTWGSSPCPTGSHLGVRDDGAIAGSVSAGCVEGAVINEAMEIIKGAAPEVFEYGVSNEMAWEVGLACGGRISVLVRCVEIGRAHV